ncbi:MAG: hypothetical protein WC222_00135 [Parachlamydiales bacterium]|jgi:hypothetical protein
MSVPPVDQMSGSSISGSGFEKTYRIDLVFQLILQVIGTLQGVAVAQAQRLQLLTSWQQAYTTLMNKIPIFTQNTSLFGGTTTEDGNLRDDENRVNSSYTEQLRSLRSQISDDSKSLQSNLNQTNDGVTQQANLATALLQELSTILSTIYR